MKNYTQDELVEFIIEQRERALNMQAAVTGSKSEHLLSYYQENIDMFNQIIGMIELNQFSDYQMKALRTANDLDQMTMLINGVLGLNGESGEIADLVKKHLYQGHELDDEKVANELGDVLWYVSLLSKAMGYSLNDIAKLNIRKLERRYPKGFDPSRSINREGETT